MAKEKKAKIEEIKKQYKKYLEAKEKIRLIRRSIEEMRKEIREMKRTQPCKLDDIAKALGISRPYICFLIKKGII